MRSLEKKPPPMQSSIGLFTHHIGSSSMVTPSAVKLFQDKTRGHLFTKSRQYIMQQSFSQSIFYSYLTGKIFISILKDSGNQHSRFAALTHRPYQVQCKSSNHFDTIPTDLTPESPPRLGCIIFALALQSLTEHAVQAATESE